MSDVRVTIGAESAAVESEFAKVQRSAGRLKKSVGDAGGVLEGDRRVENKMTAWVQGFRNAQNGADLLANTMGNLGDVFRTSLAVGVGLNVGAALVGMFSAAAKKADELKQQVNELSKALRNSVSGMDTGGILSNIDALSAKIKDIPAMDGGMRAAVAAVRDIIAGVEQLNNVANIQIDVQKAILEGDERRVQYLTKLTEMAAYEAKLRKSGALPEAEIQKLLEKESLRLDIVASIAAKKREEAEASKELTRIEQEASKAKAESDRLAKEQAQQMEKQAALAENQVDIAAKHAKEIEAAGLAEMDAADAVKQYMETSDEKIARLEQEQKAIEGLVELEGDAVKAATMKTEVHQKELEILREMNKVNDEAVKLENQKLDAAKKAAEEADKAALDKKKDALKEAEGVAKRGAEEQQARDEKAIEGILGGHSMVAQRADARTAAAARDKAAGIAARDEARRKVGGDATKMEAMKDFIEKRKKEMLGEKQLDPKEVAAAARAIPKMQADIAKLVQKMGVK